MVEPNDHVHQVGRVELRLQPVEIEEQAALLVNGFRLLQVLKQPLVRSSRRSALASSPQGEPGLRLSMDPVQQVACPQRHAQRLQRHQFPVIQMFVEDLMVLVLSRRTTH